METDESVLLSTDCRRSAPQKEAAAIDEAMIAALVERFYARVRADPLLGPVFEAHIANWTPHLERMRDFWSSVALTTGRYHGRPMDKHLALPIDAGHFDRWLSIFADTADDLCPAQAAAIFKDRAHRIAGSLELGRAAHCGVMLRKGERFHDQRQSTTENDHAD